MAENLLQRAYEALSEEDKQHVEKRAKELIEEYLTLQELRKALDLSQEDMAKKLRVKQESISQFEKRSDVMLSTLRQHVQAMGGTLDLVVSFPNRAPVKLTGYGDIPAN